MHPGAVHAGRGHGVAGRAHAAGLVRDPPLVSGAHAGRPGRRPRGAGRGRGRPLVSRALRVLLSRLAADPLLRRPAVGETGRRRLDRDGGEPVFGNLRLSRWWRHQRVQRPAARLLLRRRLDSAARAPAAALRRAGGRAPAGCRCPHQERGRPAGSLGPPGGGRVSAGGPRPAQSAVAASVAGRRRRARRLGAPPLLARGDPRALRELRPPHLREPVLARRGHAGPSAAGGDPEADDLFRRLGDLLVRRAVGPARGLARPAAPRHAGVAAGGLRAAGDRLDRLLGQPQPAPAGRDDLEPFRPAGVGASPDPLLPRSRRRAPPLPLGAFRSGRTRQISVSPS